MKKVILIIIVIFCAKILSAQQISPIELIAHPDIYQGAASGLNNNEFANKDFNASGHISFEINTERRIRTINPSTTSYITYPVSIRWNPISSERLIYKDSLFTTNIAFAENNYLFYLSYKLRNLKINTADNNPEKLFSLFFDFYYSPYTINLTDSLNITTKHKFSILHFNLGDQVGRIGNVDVFGDWGLTLSIWASFITITGEQPKAFAKVMKLEKEYNISYYGAGYKILLQIDALSLFFESRIYIPFKEETAIQEFSERFLFNVGIIANGDFLKLRY